MKKFLLFLFIFIISNSYAKETKIMVSIKPIYLIAKEIATKDDKVDLLVPTNASPHYYNLKPSDIKKLNKAKILFLIDYNLENFLKKIEISNSKIIQLAKHKDIKLLNKRNNKNKIDYHLWLSPYNAINIAKIIYQQMSLINPDNEQIYENNYNNFVFNLNKDIEVLKNKLHIKNIDNFIVFHDAYLYLENYFNIKAPSYMLHLHDNDQITIKKLLKLKNIIESENIKCIFKEPQFSDKIIYKLAKDHNLRIGILDPIGNNVGSYGDLLKDIIDSYLSCGQIIN